MASKPLIRTFLYLTLTGLVIFLLLRFFLELPVSYRYIEALFKSPWTILATLTRSPFIYARSPGAAPMPNVHRLLYTCRACISD
ncbi:MULTISPECIES: hypothetical protein [unclassified Exiguobacterium]|uniref:hypothetical protein n=1 Tax=unclassified Exiguobacterium TaxID=2644629 RepID=UPI00203574E1|nr:MULTISPECIES: hypothetical protein [unclassified Exiguobacterium]